MFIFELVIMLSVSGVVELTCFCVHVIVDTHAGFFVVTMPLADLNIINTFFFSYSVVHQTLVNEEERCSERQYTTVI